MLLLRAALVGGVLLALQGIQVPAPPRGFGTSTAEVVVDSARVLTPESVDLIDRLAFDVHAKSRGEIAVVTLPDIGDRAESDVALQIGRQWGIGGAGAVTDPSRNRGAVILIVPKETSSTGSGSCWVSTGKGTEGFITDAQAGDICREAVPYFRQRDYATGTALVALRVAQRFAGEFDFALDTSLAAPQLVGRTPPQPEAGGGGGGFNPMTIFIAFVVLMVVLNALGGRRRGGRGGCGGCLPIFIPMGGGGGGGWGGGGWSGGGGGFGGGGGGFGGFGGGGGFSGGGGGSKW